MKKLVVYQNYNTSRTGQNKCIFWKDANKLLFVIKNFDFSRIFSVIFNWIFLSNAVLMHVSLACLCDRFDWWTNAIGRPMIFRFHRRKMNALTHAADMVNDCRIVTTYVRALGHSLYIYYKYIDRTSIWAKWRKKSMKYNNDNHGNNNNNNSMIYD